MKKNISTQAGLGLMEIVLGLGILGGITFGLMTFMKNLSTTTKTHDYRSQVQAWTDEIFKTLSDRQACKNSLGTMIAASNSVNDIKDKNGATKFSLNAPMGSLGVKIASMTLTDVPGMDDTVEVKPGEPGSTRLVIKFVPSGTSQTSAYHIQKSMNLYVLTEGTTVASSTIKECYSLVAGGSLLWSKDPLNANNIYYNDGNVGVDIENPMSPLDVAGSLGVRQGTGLLLMGGSATQYDMILSDISRPFEFLNEATGGWANIRARNYRIDTYIKLAETTEPCNSTANGSIRYNNTSKQVEVCDGSAWVVKDYEEWCVPEDESHEQDDNAVWFHQGDRARRERGTGCDHHQVDEKADNTEYDDVRTAKFGYKIDHDHSDDTCANDQNCRTWRDIDQ